MKSTAFKVGNERSLEHKALSNPVGFLENLNNLAGKREE
jgi:hypothetical protein